MVLKLIRNKRFADFNLYFVFNILQKVAGIFLIPVYTRYLNPEQYGVMAVCQIIPAIIIVVLYLAIQDNIYFAVVNKNGSVAEIISTGLIFIIIISIVFVLLLILLKPFTNRLTLFHIPFYPYIYFTLLSSIGIIFSSIYLQFLQASERSIQFSILNFSLYLLSTSIMLYLLIMRHFGALSPIIANLVANCILAIVALFYFFRKYGFQFSYNQLKQMLLFSFPLIPHNLSYWIKDCIDRLLLASLSSLQNTGIYQIAISYGGMLSFGTQAFYNANTPRFFSLIKDKNANEGKIISMMPISVASFSILAFGLSLCAPEIISLLTTKNYHGAAQYIPFILVASVIFMIYNNIVNALYYEKKTVLIAIISISASIISSIVSFILVKYIGIYGAAISLICSNLIASLTFYFSAQYYLRMSWPIKKCLFLSILPLLAFIIIRLVSVLPSFQQILIKFILLLGYSLFCYLLIKYDLSTIFNKRQIAL